MKKFCFLISCCLLFFNNIMEAKILGRGKLKVAPQTRVAFIPPTPLPKGFSLDISAGALAEGIVDLDECDYEGNDGTSIPSISAQVNLTTNSIVANSAADLTKAKINGGGITVSGTPTLELNGGKGPLTLGVGANVQTSGLVTTPLRVTTGSTITAQGSTSIGDNNFPRVAGTSLTLDSNSQKVSIGVQTGIVSSQTRFLNTADLEFASKITLTGEWIYDGGTHYVSGNGNILDFSLGGTLRIKDNTTLNLTAFKLRGLGIGKILFDSPTSQIRTSFLEIEMNRDYSFTTGGIYAEGPTNIVTKNLILSFSQAASLTVDGIALTYDTTTFTDAQNIRPAGQTSGPNITLLNDGIIRHLSNIDLITQNSNAIVWLDKQLQTIDHGPNDIDINQTFTSLSFDIWLSEEHLMFVNVDSTIDGHGHFIHFSKGGTDLLNIADGKTLVLKNVVLKGITEEALGLGNDSNIIFGDKSMVSLFADPDLNSTWTFQGQAMLSGAGQKLRLLSLGNLFVTGTGSALLFDDILITGVSGNKIRGMDDSCTFSFYNTTWILDGNYSLTTGNFEVLTQWDIVGSYTFEYATNAQSIIHSEATLLLDMGTTFSYAPKSDNRDLIFMSDASSRLYMNGATLASSTTGLRLTRGALIIDKKDYLRNDDAIAFSEGIAFGNGSAADDLNVHIMPGATIDLLSGILDYQNTN